jgi:exopolyphosphatase/guanosine-5'-triphosphate,3'-diphosphate pyrophosphatase
VLYELLERDEAWPTAAPAPWRAWPTALQSTRASQQGRRDSAAPVRATRPRARGGSTTSRAGRALRKLAWAAQLHEIGTQISHSEYHKHGAYILDNADAPASRSTRCTR